MMRRIYAILALLILTMSGADAQKMTMGYIFPAGGALGDSVDIELGGLNLQNAQEVIFSGSGVKGIVLGPVKQQSEGVKGKRSKQLNDQSSPQLAHRIRVRVYIAANATIGLRDLRLKSSSGVSNKLFFDISHYPNQMDCYQCMQKGDTLDVSSLPVELCGQVPPGAVNRYRFQAERGKDYVVKVKARQLLPYIADAVPGWFQPVVRVVDEFGKECGYSDDYRDSPDPYFVFTPTQSGSFFLTIHDAIYRGREDFGYRIQLGAVPSVEECIPSVVINKPEQQVVIRGVNLSERCVSVLIDETGRAYTAQNTSRGVEHVQLPITVLPEGNQLISPIFNQPLAFRSDLIYIDSITAPYQVKRYPISLQRNKPLRIGVFARRWGSRADLEMRVVDSNGEVLAYSDDEEDPLEGLMTFHADPQIEFTPKRETDAFLVVSETTGASGGDCFFGLRTLEQGLDFQAFVSPSTLSLPSGGTAVLKFDFLSKERKNPAGRIVLRGLPPGFTVSDMQIPRVGKMLEVTVTAPHGCKPVELSVRPELQLAQGGQVDIRSVDNMMQAFYYTHRLPSADFQVAVSKPSPYTLRVEGDQEILLHGDEREVFLNVSVDRIDNFQEPIEISLHKKIKWLEIDSAVVAPNARQTQVRLKILRDKYPKMKRFRQAIILVGSVKGEIEKRGKRTFQNALYKEVSPLINLLGAPEKKRGNQQKKKKSL